MVQNHGTRAIGSAYLRVKSLAPGGPEKSLEN